MTARRVRKNTLGLFIRHSESWFDSYNRNDLNAWFECFVNAPPPLPNQSSDQPNESPNQLSDHYSPLYKHIHWYIAERSHTILYSVIEVVENLAFIIAIFHRFVCWDSLLITITYLHVTCKRDTRATTQQRREKHTKDNTPDFRADKQVKAGMGGVWLHLPATPWLTGIRSIHLAFFRDLWHFKS